MSPRQPCGENSVFPATFIGFIEMVRSTDAQLRETRAGDRILDHASSGYSCEEGARCFYAVEKVVVRDGVEFDWFRAQAAFRHWLASVVTMSASSCDSLGTTGNGACSSRRGTLAGIPSEQET
jgi:hypothetical protein